MTTKTDFTPEEWKVVVAAPLVASLYITMASPSLFGSFGEVMSATSALVKGAQETDSNTLKNAILSEFKQLDSARGAQPRVESRDQASVLAELKDELTAAVMLINTKGESSEAAGVRQWIYDIARQTADATKEGGFLGIGGVRVNDAEMDALAEIARVLQITPATSTTTA